MKTSRLILLSGAHAATELIYVGVVVFWLGHGEQLIADKNLLGPLAFLLTFVVSAAVSAALVLWRPVSFLIDGQKALALRFFGATVGWLFVFVAGIIVFALLR